MKSRKLATQILKMNYPMNSNVRSKQVTCRCILWRLVVDCLSFHGEQKPRETTKKISWEKTTHNEKRKKGLKYAMPKVKTCHAKRRSFAQNDDRWKKTPYKKTPFKTLIVSSFRLATFCLVALLFLFLSLFSVISSSFVFCFAWHYFIFSSGVISSFSYFALHYIVALSIVFSPRVPYTEYRNRKTCLHQLGRHEGRNQNWFGKKNTDCIYI